MPWSPDKVYEIEEFETERQLQTAILDVRDQLFGASRIYLNIKKEIGAIM